MRGVADAEGGEEGAGVDDEEGASTVGTEMELFDGSGEAAGDGT